MIQPLRTAHRRMFIILAGALPLILGTGLTARPHVPLPNSPALGQSQVSKPLDQATATWAKNTFDAKFYSEPGDPKRTRIVLTPRGGLQEPDLLLYWTSAVAADSTDLKTAHLLGAFRPADSYLLPAGTERLSLVLYSLAHREIVDNARVEGLP